MTIGEKICLRRKQLNMTQEELAFKMGYSSRSAINKIEMGKRDVSQSNVIKFAEALDTTIAYLMDWEDEPKKEEVPTISDEDKKFIELLHLLDPDKKEKLLALLEALAST